MKARPILFSAPMIRALLAGTKTQTRRIAKAIPADAELASADDWNATRADARMRPFEEWGPQRGYFAVRDADGPIAAYPCPYGIPGDLLIVRETFAHVRDYQGVDPGSAALSSKVFYRADHPTGVWSERDPTKEIRWRPSIHMPRAASRFTLRITDVRVERLQEISEADAIAEGLLPQIGDGLGPGPGHKWNGVGYHAGTTAKDGALCFHTPNHAGNCSCAIGYGTPAQCAYRELWERINGQGSWDANPFVWCLSFEVIQANVDEVMRREAA